MVILLVFSVLGVCVVLLSHKHYTSKTVFVPQVSSAQGLELGNLGGLASLAGFDFENSSGGEFPPTLYPKILSSAKIQLAMLNSKLIIPSGDQYDTVSYRTYYEDYYKPSVLTYIPKYTIGLPFKIIDAMKVNKGGDSESSEGSESTNMGFQYISRDELEMIEIMLEQVTISPSLKEGFVTISFTMPDPVLAAQMTSNVQELLTEVLIDYKTKNAQTELENIQRSYEERKKEFEAAQEELALFRDSNQDLSSAFALNQLERLEKKYNLASTIYTELAKKHEEAKLKLDRSTPIISIIEPITIPTKKSGPSTFLILFGSIFAGLFIFITWVFIPPLVVKLRQQLETRK